MGGWNKSLDHQVAEVSDARNLAAEESLAYDWCGILSYRPLVLGPLAFFFLTCLQFASSSPSLRCDSRNGNDDRRNPR